MTKNTIITIIKENVSMLKRYHVKKIGLFGSYGRDEESNESDIDLLVEFDESAFDENYTGYFDSITSLATDLQSLLAGNVDLLTSDMISPYIAPNIFKEVKYIEGL